MESKSYKEHAITLEVSSQQLHLKINSPYVMLGIIGLGLLSSFWLFRTAKKTLVKAQQWDIFTQFQQSEFIRRDSSLYNKQDRYAVIYGAGSKVGQAFAKYLAERNYGLILIDFSLDRIHQTEIYLQENVKQYLNIVKIMIDHQTTSIDDQKILKSIEGLSNFCIDCFINACNTYQIGGTAKPKQSLFEKEKVRDTFLECELLRQLYKKNIETFAQLIQKFHKHLKVVPLYSALINVRRKVDEDSSQELYISSKDMCKVFYRASCEFNQYFSKLVGCYFQRKVRAVTIQIDYDKSRNDDEYLSLQVKKAFRLLSYD